MSKIISRLTTFAIALTISACGGGGGGGGIASSGSSGGIGGTGITSSGTIDGFGSIFVNGVKFETGEAEITVNGSPASESDLGLGMVVVVSGTVNSDGNTGDALEVFFDNELQGPVASITPGADGDTKLLVVLGREIIIERTGTVFEDVTFDSIAVDDLIEASGFVNEDLQLRATRIEKKSSFIPGSSEVELNGVVTNLSGNTFNLGEFLVDFSSADLSDVPNGTISNGMTVEVKGTLTGMTINASEVEEEDDIGDFLDNDDDVEVKGAITDFVSNGDFKVSGVPVDASGAVVSPQGLVLENGVIVEAEGTWNGNTLIASEVEARRGRIEIEAAVAAVDTGNNSITLQLFPGTVTVKVDQATRLEDDTDGVENLTLGDISIGDFLEVEAIQQGSDPIATRIDRDDRDDDILQGPVDAFTPGVDITVLGITYSTLGADFENQNDENISSDTFYSQLQVGDLVKIKDEEVADGIADEVEFEDDDDLDGDREFDDDCDSDDDSDSDSSGDSSDGSCGSDDDESDDDSSGSGSGSDDDPDDDSSGSGSGSDDDPDDDSSGSGSGSDDDPDIDNSGSGSGSDEEPDEDNSGSGS
jgi:hypothetical protein